MIKLLRKDKDVRDGICNFRPLMMLNTEVNILANILASSLQFVHSSLNGSEKTRAVNCRHIQDNLHMAHLTIEKIDSEAALTNLDQPETFVSVDHRLLEAVFLVVCSGPDNRTCMRPPVRCWK